MAVKYTVTYNKGDGSGTSTSVQFSGSTTVAEITNVNGQDWSRSGYQFLKWSTYAGEGIYLFPGDTISNTKTLVAVWQQSQPTLSINPNGGIWNNSTSVTSVAQSTGTTYNVSNPTRSGYNFAGWSLTGSGSFSNGIYTFGNSDGVLIANWELIIVEYKATNAEFIDVADHIRAKAGITESMIWPNGFKSVIDGIEVSSGDALIAFIEEPITGAFENSKITKIRDAAFCDCRSLTTVSFPVCTTIGSYAFSNCRSLTTASFPACTSIGDGAFYYCDRLTTASFPACTSIGHGAFEYCFSLTTARFPVCTMIGNSTFYNCRSLTTASFPACTSIGDGAFCYCDRLTTASFSVCTTIGSYAFSYCRSLTTVSFPVCTTIGSGAFSNCSSLTTASFSVCTTIGSYAFGNCYSLTTVILTASQTASRICSSAFYCCYNLTSLYLLASTMYNLSNKNAFTSTPISTYTTSTGGVYGSIFVRESLYASYIAATNWATYSARFVSLTDAQVAKVMASGTHT